MKAIFMDKVDGCLRIDLIIKYLEKFFKQLLGIYKNSYILNSKISIFETIITSSNVMMKKENDLNELLIYNINLLLYKTGSISFFSMLTIFKVLLTSKQLKTAKKLNGKAFFKIFTVSQPSYYIFHYKIHKYV